MYKWHWWKLQCIETPLENTCILENVWHTDMIVSEFGISKKCVISNHARDTSKWVQPIILILEWWVQPGDVALPKQFHLVWISFQDHRFVQYSVRCKGGHSSTKGKRLETRLADNRDDNFPCLPNIAHNLVPALFARFF